MGKPINKLLNEMIKAGAPLFSPNFDVQKLQEVLNAKNIKLVLYPGTKSDLLQMVKEGKIAAEFLTGRSISEWQKSNAVVFTQDGNFIELEAWEGTQSMKLMLSEKDQNDMKNL